MDVVAQGLQHLAVPAKGDDDIRFLRVDRAIAPLKLAQRALRFGFVGGDESDPCHGARDPFGLPGAGRLPGLPAGRRRV